MHVHKAISINNRNFRRQAINWKIRHTFISVAGGCITMAVFVQSNRENWFSTIIKDFWILATYSSSKLPLLFTGIAAHDALGTDCNDCTGSSISYWPSCSGCDDVCATSSSSTSLSSACTELLCDLSNFYVNFHVKKPRHQSNLLHWSSLEFVSFYLQTRWRHLRGQIHGA